MYVCTYIYTFVVVQYILCTINIIYCIMQCYNIIVITITNRYWPFLTSQRSYMTYHIVLYHATLYNSTLHYIITSYKRHDAYTTYDNFVRAYFKTHEALLMQAMHSTSRINIQQDRYAELLYACT